MDYGEHYEFPRIYLSNLEQRSMEWQRCAKYHTIKYLFPSSWHFGWQTANRQYTSDEPEGIRYQRIYPFDRHPHIGIIDPRTGMYSIDCVDMIGEQVKTWNATIQPREFIFEIHDFLERYSLSEEARNPLGRKNKLKKVWFYRIFLTSEFRHDDGRGTNGGCFGCLTRSRHK